MQSRQSLWCMVSSHMIQKSENISVKNWELEEGEGISYYRTGIA